MSDFTLVVGDCHEAMRQMADCSIDAVVTDPPYGLTSNRKGRSPATEGAVMRGFMGLQWDGSVPDVDVFAEMYRVLKDGGRLLCFAGTRTFHRMWCNIEDAGFTIEDTIAWMYGSGFPKHRSKLKPAYEPICVARKGGVSELNIDACRIVVSGDDPNMRAVPSLGNRGANSMFGMGGQSSTNVLPEGRWPANVVLDEEAARMLDEMSGTLESGDGAIKRETGADRLGNRGAAYGAENRPAGSQMIGYGDSGGASRFFYTSKASRSEREFGLEGVSTRDKATAYGDGLNSATKVRTEEQAHHGVNRGNVANHHPTVKPVDLMRWLVRLVTQPGQTVLDPFMGSGTTGVAAIQEGRNFIGIEIDEAYVEIARKRIGNAPLSLFAQPDGAA